MLIVHEPYAFNARQHQPVKNGIAPRKHTDDLIRRVGMFCTRVSNAVGSRELGADGKFFTLRDFRSNHGLQRFCPQPASRQLAAIMRDVVMGRADDAKTLVTVTQRERDRLLDHAMLRDLFRLREWNVPGRNVEVINGRQYDLHRTALRTGHEIDAAGIARHTLLDLVRGEQQQRYRSDPQCQQEHVQQGIEGARTHVTHRKRCNVHTRYSVRTGPSDEVRSAPSRNWFGMRALMRWSCVAITSVALQARAWACRSSSACMQRSSSRLEVGSSANNSFGRFTTARATATR